MVVQYKCVNYRGKRGKMIHLEYLALGNTKCQNDIVRECELIWRTIYSRVFSAESDTYRAGVGFMFSAFHGPIIGCHRNSNLSILFLDSKVGSN